LAPRRQAERLDAALQLTHRQIALPRIDPGEPHEQIGIRLAGRGQQVIRVRLDAGRRLGIGAKQHAHQAQPSEPLGHRVVGFGENGAAKEALVIFRVAGPGLGDPRITRVNVEVDPS
jgi:hypothetical protein